MNRISSNESRIRDIALSDIDRSRNHRIPMPGDAEKIEAMKTSLIACGQLQPVRVYERGADQKNEKHKEKFILGFGNRRCAAMELLGEKTIRAIVFGPASDAEIAQARAVENLHRQDITPLEEVLAVTDVLEAVKADEKFTGDPYEEAATRLARSPAWVRDRDYLHRLTKPVQKFAMRSGLPAGHLRELAKVGDPIEQMRLACESVGGPSWCFAASEKDAKIADHAEAMQNEFFAELADGQCERWPLTKLKTEVGKVQLSLKVIPWEFDRSIEHGDVKLRKCSGCPHNSETDRTLFGIDEDSANPRGFCLNASCYNAKQRIAEEVKQEVYRKMAARQIKTPEAIKKAVPEWMKESSVVGYVKRQMEKASNGEVDKKEKARPSHRCREFTEHEKALRKFAEEYDRWEGLAWRLVLKGINATPLRRVGWCVLLGVKGFWDHPRPRFPRVSEYSQPTTEQPSVPELPKGIDTAIRLAFKGSREAWVKLLAKQEQPDPDRRQGVGVPHPAVLVLLADAVDLKLPPVPVWSPVKAASKEPAKESGS